MQSSQQQENPRRRVVGAIVVLAIAVSALVVGVTGAIFTDTAAVDDNTFTTGTVDISVSPASTALSATSMAPGDRANGSITVSNAGSLGMRYAVQGSATNPDSKGLGGALRVRIALQGGGACNFPYYNSDGTTASIGDDTPLYEGLGLGVSPSNLVGDVAQGSQTGDRALTAASSEVLCVSAVLPLSAANALQAATTTVTFDFASEQTANNP